MADEFRIRFENIDWFITNAHEIKKMMTSLRTFIAANPNGEYWLRGLEKKGQVKTWDYDARLFIERESIFLEISTRSGSIQEDLMALCLAFREQSNILILNEDDEPSSW